MKKIGLKFLSLLLALSMLCGLAACTDKTVTTSKTKGDTSSQADTDDSSTDGDITDIAEEIDLDLDLGDLDLGDFDFDDFDLGDFNIDLVANTTYTFNSNAVQSDYGGLGGVFSGDWFLPDSTNEFGKMTDKERELSIKRFKQMGVSVVRYFGFQPGFAWDDTNDKWDWDSEYMQGFYEFADLMKENGVEIILNIIEGFDYAQMGEPTPFADFYKAETASDKADKKDALYQGYYADWIVNVVNEVIVKRGYTNVTSIMYATEPNNSTQNKGDDVDYAKFINYSGYIKASHNALKAAGLRDKVEFIGPNCPINIQQQKFSGENWLRWSIDQLNDYLDVYSIHMYTYAENMGQDTADIWEEYLAKWVKWVEPTGKKFCHDEYNCLLRSGDNEDMNDPYQATQLALAQIQTMANGANTNLIWTLWDIKFCGSTKTELPRFDEGYQRWGIHPSVEKSTIPHYAYYVYCMLGTAIKSGDTVYAGTADESGTYSVLIKHKNGKYSIVAINMSLTANNITFKMPSGISGEFDRLVYDPATFKKTTEGTPITATSTVKVSSSWTDTLSGYNVVVYNQK